MQKIILKSLPILLALAFVCIWFYPEREQLVGWGGDPAFNLWTLEHVWKQLSTLGLLKIFSPAFWSTPIFFPAANTLAYSENQLIPGILSWPIRAWSGNGVFTLNLFAACMCLASFVFSALWFRSLGIERYAYWGALLFQACGWMQDQYAHYQNICIFVFPLALLSWQAFRKQPSLLRLIFCGFCFGTVGGWNIYFQILTNILFGVLVSDAFLRRKSNPDLKDGVSPCSIKRSWLILLVASVGLFELPFALKYFEVEKTLGSFKVPTLEYIVYKASLKSLFAHTNGDSLLQRLVPFYPHEHLPIEKVGFLGFAWLFAWLLSSREPKARIFAASAALFFWVALGPQFGLFNVVKIIPGVEGMRAIGRIQVLVAFFSLTGILIYLEHRAFRKADVLLGLLVLEVFPGNLPKREPVAETYFGARTPLEDKLATDPQRHPWLIARGMEQPKFQLSLLRSGVPLYNGYSGRVPFNTQLLEVIHKNETTPETLKTEMIFTGAQRLMSITPELSQTLNHTNFLKPAGCYSHHEFSVCLFEAHWQDPKDLARVTQPRIQLDQDTQWETPSLEKGHVSVLSSRKAGILDFTHAGRCRIAESVGYEPPFSYTQVRSLVGHGFQKVEFLAGEEMVRNESKQWVYSWPKGIRPKKAYGLICGP